MNFSGIDQHAVGYFSDSLAGDSSLGLHVKQSAYALNHDSLNGVAFVQLELQNQSGISWDSLCVGLYTDFEVRNFRRNKADYDTLLRLGYSWSTDEPNAYAGMVLLTDQEPAFFAIDALASTANGNINLFDGFSKIEKWRTISNGLSRTSAGIDSDEGNNVVQVQSAKLRGFESGTSRRVAFAYVLADSLEGLKKQAQSARHFYRQRQTSPKPILPEILYACQGDSIELAPPNGSSFYFAPIGLLPVIFTGRSFKFQVNADTLGFWVTCIDSMYASEMVQVLIVRSSPSAIFLAEPDSVILNDSPLARFTATQNQGNSRWYINDTLRASSSIFEYSFSLPGTYRICLSKTDSIGCRDSVCIDYQVNLRVNQHQFFEKNQLSIWPNPAEKSIRLFVPENVISCDLINLNGHILKHVSNPKYGMHSILIQDLPIGMYAVKVQLSSGQIFTDRFVKQ